MFLISATITRKLDEMVMKKPCHILALLLIVRIIGSDVLYPHSLGVLGVTMFIDDDDDDGPPQGWLAKSSADGNGPEYVTAILGQSVVLNCAIEFPDGVPVPYIVQWNKQGDKVPIYIWYAGYPPHKGEGYKKRISLVNQASINISDIQESDQGWYQCNLLFLNRVPDPSKNGTWVHLDVHAPPHFTVTPLEIYYVKVGDSLILTCEADGTPKPTVIWFKDDKPLEPSGNIQLYSSGHEVRITSLRQLDTGNYICEARNGEGHISHTTRIIIAGGAVITIPPHNITKLEGNKAEFICEAKAQPSNITYKWYRNDIDINELSWLITRTVKRSDGTLVLDPLTADDTGKYTCEVSNGIGTPQSAAAYLDVEFPARVTYTPTLQYLPLGLSGVIRCHFEANPPFQFVTWSKDKRLFKPTTTDGIIPLNNGSLFIRKVTQGEQGLYTCTPFNIHSTDGASGIMEVLVREPPKFVIKPKESYQSTVNGEVKMPCEAQGSPKPDIIWRRADGVRLPRERTQSRGGNLTIKYLKKADYGYYECVVQNEVATLVTSTLLIVEMSSISSGEGTTPHAPTNLTVNTSAYSATISWLPAYDGGYAQSYVVWYRESDRGDASWRMINVSPEGATSITVYNLVPNTSYDFRILSRNRLGESLHTAIVKSITKSTTTHGPPGTPAGPKSAAPSNVSVIAANDGIKISWTAPPETVSYYIVEHKIDDGQWTQVGGQIKASSYFLKNPLGGKTYHFRVSSCTMPTSCGGPSSMVKFIVPANFKDKAITAGVVGGILFFIVAIILSICAVKICNKRKRRRQERAYSMVACRVTDVRNGGHGPAGSPVPLRKKQEGEGD